MVPKLTVLLGQQTKIQVGLEDLLDQIHELHFEIQLASTDLMLAWVPELENSIKEFKLQALAAE